MRLMALQSKLNLAHAKVDDSVPPARRTARLSSDLLLQGVALVLSTQNTGLTVRKRQRS